MALHVQLLHLVNELVWAAEIEIFFEELLTFEVVWVNTALIHDLNAFFQLYSRTLQHARLKTRSS